MWYFAWILGLGLALLPPQPPGAIWVPVTLGTVRVFAPLPPEIRSWVRLRGAPGADTAAFDVILADPTGRVLIEVAGITFRAVAAEAVDTEVAGAGRPRVLVVRHPDGEPIERLLASAAAGGDCHVFVVS